MKLIGVCRNVSFKYPKSDSYALKNISFKIEQGQLCVIVGTNGSGSFESSSQSSHMMD